MIEEWRQHLAEHRFRALGFSHREDDAGQIRWNADYHNMIHIIVTNSFNTNIANVM